MKKTYILRCADKKVKWQWLPPFPWRNSKAKQLFNGCFLSGTRMGPRPIVVLPGVIASNLEQIKPFMSKNTSQGNLTTPLDQFLLTLWEHGAILLAETIVNPLEGNDGQGLLFQKQIEAIKSLIGYFLIDWVHLVCYSSGSIQAVQLASTIPQHIGTITLLDTPLATTQMIEQENKRILLDNAKDNINISTAAINKISDEISNESTDVLPHPLCPSHITSGLIESNTFNHLNSQVYEHIFGKHTYSEDRCERNLKQFSTNGSILDLESIRHPLMIISPKKDSTVDLPFHQDFFNVKHKVVLNDPIVGHEGLFSNKSTEQISKEILKWCLRWEMDQIIKLKFDHSIQETRRLLENTNKKNTVKSTSGKKENKYLN